jgi:hypothetical protein
VAPGAALVAAPWGNFPVMAPAVALALVGDCALAAEMPEDFQGKWCTSSNTLKDDWHAYNVEGADCSHDYSSVEITATKVSIPALSMSCVVRQVTKFDVCPWGMIFRSRERARALRSFQVQFPVNKLVACITQGRPSPSPCWSIMDALTIFGRTVRLPILARSAPAINNGHEIHRGATRRLPRGIS